MADPIDIIGQLVEQPALIEFHIYETICHSLICICMLITVVEKRIRLHLGITRALRNYLRLKERNLLQNGGVLLRNSYARIDAGGGADKRTPPPQLLQKLQSNII